MCLAVPSRIVSISGTTAEVDIMGNRTFADLSIVDDAKVGDYVLVHAGMAIQKYDEDEARKTLELFRDIAALDMNQ